MRQNNFNKKPSPSREIAYIAVMTALLLGGQAVLSWVAGIEVVTVLLLCFSFTFGMRAGALTAIAFSLLRCFIWGFYPSVIVLYLIYYPLFALLFGALGSIKKESFEKFPVWAAMLVNLLLFAIMSGAGYAALTDVLKISVLAITMVKTFLWVIFAVTAALTIIFNLTYLLFRAGKIKSAQVLIMVTVTALATVCTVSFSLLDDIITPLFMGWGLFSVTSATYFYASFLALAPQTACTAVTVSAMFLPLTAMFEKAGKL